MSELIEQEHSERTIIGVYPSELIEQERSERTSIGVYLSDN